MAQQCPRCDRATLTRNGKTKTGNQKYLCRVDRGGCGYSRTDSQNKHGGDRGCKIYRDRAEKQRAYRLREKEKKAIAGAKSTLKSKSTEENNDDT